MVTFPLIAQAASKSSMQPRFSTSVISLFQFQDIKSSNPQTSPDRATSTDFLVSSIHSNPMLAGNVVALLSPLIYIPVLTYAFGPQNYDYKSMKLIRLGDDTDIAALQNIDIEDIPGVHASSISGPSPSSAAAAAVDAEMEKEQAKLTRASLIAKSLTGFMTIALLILWPMPMYGSAYVFSKKFFTGWVSVGILWLFCSALCVGIYPLWEGRHSMRHTFGGIMRDLRGGGKPVLRGRGLEDGEESEEGGVGKVEEVGEKEDVGVMGAEKN